jgi:hypothetical protein
MIKRVSFLVVLLALCARPLAAQDAATHVACSAAQAVAAAADMLHVEAGPDKSVFVWKVWIIPGTQTTAGFHQIVLRRTTSASSGGSTVTPAPINPFSQAFTGIVRYGAAGGGADGVTLVAGAYFVPTATTSGPENQFVVFDATLANARPILIASGGATGLELRNATGGVGGANHYACVLFTEQDKK